MKRLSFILAAIFSLVLCGQAYPAPFVFVPLDQPTVDTDTASRVQWMYDQEKLTRDLNRELVKHWDDQNFSNTAVANQRHMNELMSVMNAYGIQPLMNDDEVGVFGDERHAELYSDLLLRAQEGYVEAFMAVAYLQERNVSDYRSSILATQEKPLRDAFERSLAGNKNHLRLFAWLVSYLTPPVHYYFAQWLDQQDVDAILGLEGAASGGEFEINPGLNGAWYYPATPGQGFFVTVYPQSKTILVAWMTYDTELPAVGTPASVGNAGQRWLVAQGNYAGGYAGLRLDSARGGLFDSFSEGASLVSVGSLRLQFESCSSGSAMYYLPDIGLESTIPLQRIASDNVARCEAGE